MSLSYPLTFPSSIQIQSFTLRYVKSVAMSESPFSYAQQVHDFGGGRWEAEITIPPLKQSDAQVFQAFLIGLKGRFGTFTMSHPLHSVSLSRTASGTKGDSDVDFNGSVDAGTYFSVDNHLYLTLETGTALVEIQPPLRTTISSATIDTTLPLGTWRLATNDVDWTTGSSAVTPFTFACIEAV
jgi:hypothetical protein